MTLAICALYERSYSGPNSGMAVTGFGWNIRSPGSAGLSANLDVKLLV
jgi:hypothetical protein